MKDKVLTKADLIPDDLWAHLRVNLILLSLPMLLYFFHFLFDKKMYFAAFCSFVFLGAQIYKVTIIFHDLAHLTLFRSRGVSLFHARVCEALLGTSLSKYRKLHFHHHRWCGTESDTEEGIYRELEGKGAFSVLWFLLEPLTGLTYIRNFFGGRIRINEDMLKPDKFTAPTKVRLINIMIIHGVLVLFASHFFSNLYFVAVYPLAAITFALFFSRIRGVAEHLPITEKHKEGECFMRTHYFNFIDFAFFYCLNMNYHYEHHTYPQVPSVNLPKISERVRDSKNTTHENYRKSIFHTLLCVLIARIKKQ